MDTMPMPQKILLGMDFVIEHGLCIDAPNDTICITTPKSKAALDNLPRLAMENITLHPYQSHCVSLAFPSSLSITHTSGYIYPDNALPDGCILWHGVYALQHAGARVWLTNVLDKPIIVNSNTPLAWAELDSSGEILRADRLREAALHKLNSDPMAVLTLSTASNGEDWEWCDDHLYLDISQTPVGNPDPPVDATITQLQDALQQGAKELAEAKNFTVNG
jgi:hypothetical protein